MQGSQLRLLPKQTGLCLRAAILIGSLIAASSAQSAIQISDVFNASHVERTTSGGTSGGAPETTSVTIYGGSAGPAPQTSTGAPYNSCMNPAGTTTSNRGLYPCNDRRIYPDLLLTINFTSNSSSGRPVLVTAGSSPVLVELDPSSPSSSTKGLGTSVVVSWGSICAALASAQPASTIGANCEFTSTWKANMNFKIGVTTDNSTNLADSADLPINVATMPVDFDGNSFVDDCDETSNNPYGICHFEVHPGDEKVSLRRVVPWAGKNGPGLQFRYVKVLFSTLGFADIMADSPYELLSITGSETDGLRVTPSVVDRLQNDVQYFFKIAAVDLAGNVGFYSKDSTGAGDGDQFCLSESRGTDCRTTAPGEVVGLLSQEMNCFVATAAFGSPLEPRVKILRRFRNEFLLTSKLGSDFVRFYYEHSPRFARMIAESETLRATSRLILLPFLGYAWLALELGAVGALLTLMVSFAMVIFLLRTSISLFKRSRMARGSSGVG
jgi:hypothetical protein